MFDHVTHVKNLRCEFSLANSRSQGDAVVTKEQGVRRGVLFLNLESNLKKH